MKNAAIRSLLLSFGILCCASASAATSTQDPCPGLEAANKELESTYKRLLIKYKSDTRFVRKLKKSQQSWKAYRDDQVQLIFPLGDSADYGSVYPDCKCQILRTITKDRISSLDQWLTGIEAGEVCTGSREVKN
jgi:uncharacterized protein YecT (DUF1311 family)